jgi:hypothetical protein
MSWNNLVSTTMDYGPYGWDLITGRRRDFFHPTVSRPAMMTTQPHIQWVLTALFPAVKRPGREADQLPPSSAEVKNGGAIPQLCDMTS